MGIQLLGASTGLSASDLVTIPNYTVIGSYFSTTNVSSIDISLTNPSLYRSFHVRMHGVDSPAGNSFYLRLNNVSSASTYRSISDISGTGGGVNFYSFGSAENTSFRIQYTGTSNARYAWFDIYNVNSSDRKVIKGRLSYSTPSYSALIEDIYGDANISAAITSINFLPDSGSIRTINSTSQGIIVYGVK